MTTKSTLVLGGTGKTGRRVAARLIERGMPVRIGSRSNDPSFDWADPDTWPAALENVRAAYVSYYPDLAATGAADAIEAFTELALKRGIKRLVLLSGRDETEAQRCERIVQNAGAEWTIVRASWFSQNFSESYLLEPILAGEVALPAGKVGAPFVDADDIADIAAAALIEDRRVGQLYEVTGPRVWTFAEAIVEIARVTRRNIRYVQVSLEEYVSVLEQAQLEPEFVALMWNASADAIRQTA